MYELSFLNSNTTVFLFIYLSIYFLISKWKLHFHMFSFLISWLQFIIFSKFHPKIRVWLTVSWWNGTRKVNATNIDKSHNSHKLAVNISGFDLRKFQLCGTSKYYFKWRYDFYNLLPQRPTTHLQWPNDAQFPNYQAERKDFRETPF